MHFHIIQLKAARGRGTAAPPILRLSDPGGEVGGGWGRQETRGSTRPRGPATQRSSEFEKHCISVEITRNSAAAHEFRLSRNLYLR